MKATYFKLLAIIVIMLLTGITTMFLASCDQQTNHAVQAISTVAFVSTPIEDTVSATKQAFTDEIKKNEAATMAILTLTPFSPRTPGPPKETPYPTPTLEMGFQHSCQTAGGQVALSSCWLGIVNGQLISIGAGAMWNHLGQSYGVVVIRNGDDLVNFTGSAPPTDVYMVPAALDVGKIVSIQGNLMVLTQFFNWTTPSLFYFDLSTRQWLNAAGTPLPTLTPAPTVGHK